MSDSEIIYRNLNSPLGEMIAGATARGVCFLEWQDRGGVERIKQRVEKRYRLQLRRGSSRHLDQLEDELVKYFERRLKIFRVPVDVCGTRFEQFTWEQLNAIPYGETRTYGDLAVALGKPGGARAVGRACGANYLGIVIPCHRVIEADGGLRGYGGKLWRKRRLLELEGALTPALEI